jgi:hypothetical protein
VPSYVGRALLQRFQHPTPTIPKTSPHEWQKPHYGAKSTATGTAKETVKQKRSKAIDMRFYWIRDLVRQGQFHVYWGKGSRNRADYFTKHYPASHHKAICSTYLSIPLTILRIITLIILPIWNNPRFHYMPPPLRRQLPFLSSQGIVVRVC